MYAWLRWDRHSHRKCPCLIKTIRTHIFLISDHSLKPLEYNDPSILVCEFKWNRKFYTKDGGPLLFPCLPMPCVWNRVPLELSFRVKPRLTGNERAYANWEPLTYLHTSAVAKKQVQLPVSAGIGNRHQLPKLKACYWTGARHTRKTAISLPPSLRRTYTLINRMCFASLGTSNSLKPNNARYA
jgi:hypothetical protein